jgi:hypothetical protein
MPKKTATSNGSKKPLLKSAKFQDVREALLRDGAALMVGKDGTESLYVHSPYQVDYIQSYAQDSPFFLGLAEGRLRGTKCEQCNYVYGTPRGHCQFCGGPNVWVDLPLKGRVHTWTTCYYSGEAFLKETPFNLAMIEFDGVNGVLLARLKDCKQDEIYVGMPVEARFAKKPAYSITDIWFVPA